MRIILKLFVLLFPVFLFGQASDTIKLISGESLGCHIYRVGHKHVYFVEMEGAPVNKIALDAVDSYEFNNDFFQTNLQGQLEHSEVIQMEGFKSHEIYRGLEDWFYINSDGLFGGVYFSDEQEMIIHGTVSTRNYLRLDWVSFYQTLNVAAGDNSEIDDCALFYDVIVRVKRGRFKIIATNFVVKRNYVHTKINLASLYEKSRNKNGSTTPKHREIEKLKGFLQGQFAAISAHCEDVRASDSFKEDIIKLMLADDEW